MSKTTIDFDGLRKVIEAVEKADAEHFEMGTWVDRLACGFCGCAIGWFCHCNPDDALRIDINLPVLGKGSRPLLNWEAVEKRFGLTRSQATFLFDSTRYRDGDDATRRRVKSRIKRFIAKHEPTTAAH
jgi:hypothetical protein